ncbi:MAG: XdhC family protein [Arenicellales bacterium]
MSNTDSILEKARELKGRGTPFVLATVVRCESPTSAKPGAKAIIDAQGAIEGWIGGGCAQPAVVATAKKALKDGRARLIRISPNKEAVEEEGIIDFGMTCHSGGTLDIFIDPIVQAPALLVIGASPAAISLTELASRSGFEVTAAFPKADKILFPDAHHIVEDLEPSGLQGVKPAFVVIATQGKRDEEGLEAALATGASYIAFIASRRKASKLREYLAEKGYSADRVNAIVSPAGLDIGAVTPEEIAVSVLASLVKERRARAAESMAETNVETPAARDPVEQTATDPICGMTVQIAAAEYQSEYRGRTYYFCCAGCQHNFEKQPERYVA